jgi:hypothetical protein
VILGRPPEQADERRAVALDLSSPLVQISARLGQRVQVADVFRDGPQHL